MNNDYESFIVKYNEEDPWEFKVLLVSILSSLDSNCEILGVDKNGVAHSIGIITSKFLIKISLDLLKKTIIDLKFEDNDIETFEKYLKEYFYEGIKENKEIVGDIDYTATNNGEYFGIGAIYVSIYHLKEIIETYINGDIYFDKQGYETMIDCLSYSHMTSDDDTDNILNGIFCKHGEFILNAIEKGEHLFCL